MECISKSMQLFLLLLVFRLAVQDQEQELGFISESPETAIVPLGGNATFSCTAVGYVFWEINGAQVILQWMAHQFAAAEIYVPLSTLNHSVVIVTATARNNGSNVTCLVERKTGDISILNRSISAQLIVAYGWSSTDMSTTAEISAPSEKTSFFSENAAFIVGGLLAVAFLVCETFFCCWKIKRDRSHDPATPEDDWLYDEMHTKKHQQLIARGATHLFHPPRSNVTRTVDVCKMEDAWVFD